MVTAELLEVLVRYHVSTHLTQTTVLESHSHEFGTGTEILSLSGPPDRVNRELLLADGLSTSRTEVAEERARTAHRKKFGDLERVFVVLESPVLHYSRGLVLSLPLGSMARFSVSFHSGHLKCVFSCGQAF